MASSTPAPSAVTISSSPFTILQITASFWRSCQMSQPWRLEGMKQHTFIALQSNTCTNLFSSQITTYLPMLVPPSSASHIANTSSATSAILLFKKVMLIILCHAMTHAYGMPQPAH
eukprot:14253228-Ditylum_brightwellii.AAC.1